MKNMLCNLMEYMLTNWDDAKGTVHMVKTRILEIDAQLMEMERPFAWKGNTSNSSYRGIHGESHYRGGGGSGSAMGGMILPTRGGSGSATGCTMVPPPAPAFSIPSTVELLIKHLKAMAAQQPAL